MPCVEGVVQETHAFSQGESTTLLTEVAYDYFGSEVYYIMVSMNASIQGNEFVFGLVTGNRVQGTLKNTFDSNVANAIVPKQHRAGVTKTLLRQAEKLVLLSQKPSFFMVTFLTGLPEKALVKYSLLTHVCKTLGYTVVRSEPVPGKHFWMLNRPASMPLTSSQNGPALTDP